MDRLDALATELRSELGNAPVAHDTQWRRLQRDERFAPPTSAGRRRFAAGIALAAAALLLWVFIARPPSRIAERVDPARGSKELDAVTAPLEHQLADTSLLLLDRQSRGRLDETDDGTRFQLESGKVRLEVSPQEGRRFQVLAGGYVVTVAGSRFAVWVGTAGRVTVEVAVGVLTVTPPRGGPAVQLSAGEKLEGDAEGRVSVGRRGASSVPLPSRVEPKIDSAETPAVAPPNPLDAAKAGLTASTPEWRAHFRSRRYSEALAAARAQGVDRLLKELDAGALSDLADVARLGGDSSLNVRVLRSLRSRFPGTKHASRAAFLLGRALALGGAQREAASAFEAHLAEDPHGAHSVEALGRLMELYSDLGDRERARSRAERYLERAPTGPYQRLARSLAHP